MIYNYKGSVDRGILSDLEYLCDRREEEFKKIKDELRQKKSLSIFTNLDPFTGCPDEMSEGHEITSVKAGKKFIDDYFLEMLDRYISKKSINTNDFLIARVVEFMRKNVGKFPSEKQMKDMELEAEKERRSKEPKRKINMDEEILTEILSLAEEIMRLREKNNPDDIFHHLEPYDDELFLKTEDEDDIQVRQDVHYGKGTKEDYSLIWYKHSIGARLRFAYDGSHKVKCKYYDTFNECNDISSIVEIHKSICKIATAEGVKFLSEVDYNKISA